MGAVDFLQTTSQLDAFDGVCEFIVTFQDGNEALDEGHYVVREHQAERPLGMSPPVT